MKRIFNATTFKLIDFTTCYPLNYHFNCTSEPDCYDTQCEATYQIDPRQMYVNKVDISITSANILAEILNKVPNAFDYSTGYQFGFSDGYFSGTRKTFEIPQTVTWSYLVGYEYGVQLGTYYRQYR